MENAHGLAAVAILGSLLNTLVEKKVLARDEARKVAVAAYDRLGLAEGRAGAAEAHKIVARIAQVMALIVAITAVGSIVGLELLQMGLDRLGHLFLDDLGQCLPAERTIIFAQL